jgi:CheY-like chemotaxis protein
VAAAGPVNRGGTILVVDDEPRVRKIVTRQLASFGYDTIEAGSASEALDIIGSKESFDLLFTDMVMPGGMSGLQLARAALERKSDLKVLLTSGFPDLKTHHDSFLNIAMINKPYRRRDLQHAVRKILDVQ